MTDGDRGARGSPTTSFSVYARPIEDRADSWGALDGGPEVADEVPWFSWQRKAESAIASKDWEGALVAARFAVEHGPEVAHNHLLLSTALEARGSLPEALTAAETAGRLDHGRTLSVFARMGQLRWSVGDLAGAVAAYGEALERDPGFTVARKALALLGPPGRKVLDRFEGWRRTVRLAMLTLGTPLWLDGFAGAGTRTSTSDGHPDLGPAPFNLGDQFVALSLARVLHLEQFYTLRPEAPQVDFDRINQECDLLIIRGSCFLYPGFFSQHVGAEVLRKIKIPMVYVGAGVQFDLNEPMRLLPADVECLRIIHDRCVSSSVRGPRSAELLDSYGIHNVRVTGCPTIVWSLEREIHVRRPSLDRAAWTLTDLSWSPGATLAQLQHLRRLHDVASRLYVVAQGGEVVLQRWLSWSSMNSQGQRHDEAESPFLTRSTYRPGNPATALSDLAYYYRQWPADLLDALQTSGFFASDVSAALRFLREMSLVCGTRLHGNLMALSQGVPAVFCIHDARVAEMVELMQAPAFVLGEDVDFDLEGWDWSHFERRYRAIYDGFVDFFAENGLPHNLRPAPGPRE